MKCRKIEKFLLRSFDDRLNREEKDMLNNHLKNCLLCQSKYQEMAAAMQERIAEWDWKHRAGQYYDLFRRLIEKTVKEKPTSVSRGRLPSPR